MNIIDLSTPISDHLPVDPPIQMASIEYINHTEGVPSMLEAIPGITEEDLPDRAAWAVELIKLCTHTGTHMDAPWHFHPTMNNGERAWTIDEIPLEWCISDGVMVDFSDKPDGYICTQEDFKDYFEMVGYKLKERDIVLVHTSATEAWGKSEYLTKGCGIGRDATLWLTSQGVRITGTDSWSWDAPLSLVAQKFKETGDASIIWEGHKSGMNNIYCHMEKLGNLDKLPPYGFKVIAFPINIEKASAGWVRPVALFL